MIKKTAFITLSLLLSISSISLSVAEEEMDVDLADSLDFENFHKSKKSAIKVYDPESGEFFTREPGKNQKNMPVENATSPAHATTTAPQTNTTAATYQQTTVKKKPYQARQRYTTGTSDQTSDSATTAVNALHKKMAQQCPKGWVKQQEWSKHIENDDYLLHFQYHCLK